MATTTTPPYFQGWFLGSSTTMSIICPTTQIFSISGTYADCLATDATALATDCVEPKGGATLAYDNGGTHKCDATLSCDTMLVAHTSPSGTPLLTRYMCVEDWKYSTLYRELPSTSDSSSQSTGTVVASSGSLTTVPNTSTPTSTDTGSHSDSAASSSDSLSGGAVAGIVVGCVAAVVIFAMFLLRKKFVACFGGAGSKGPPPEAPPQPPPLHEIGSSAVGDHYNVHEIGSSNVWDNRGMPKPPAYK